MQAESGAGLSRRLAKVICRWTGKRWSTELLHARGQSNKRAAVKNQYLLINFPLSWLVWSQWNNVCIGSLPLHCSLSLSKPNALTGRDAIRVVSWIEPKLQEKVKKDACITGAEQEPCWFGAVTAEWLQLFFLFFSFWVQYSVCVFIWRIYCMVAKREKPRGLCFISRWHKLKNIGKHVSAWRFVFRRCLHITQSFLCRLH